MNNDELLYSPVTQKSDGSVEVQLAADHPGVTDPIYRERRNAIAAAALNWDRAGGEPMPRIDYTDTEHTVWQIACEQLHPKHLKYAHSEYVEAKAKLGLATDHIPTLDEVTSLLYPISRWSYVAAPGLVPLREFYADLAARTFNSTQYIRHQSQPLYTPEPDIVHEVVGHANQLASPHFARLTEAAGQASLRVESEEAMKFVADVFWFSMEFGVIREHGELKTYGAGILSSFGEMDAFRDMEIRPLNIAQMGTLEYDITKYQPVLFCAESLAELEDVVGGFFDTATDDSVAKYRQLAGV